MGFKKQTVDQILEGALASQTWSKSMQPSKAIAQAIISCH